MRQTLHRGAAAGALKARGTHTIDGLASLPWLAALVLVLSACAMGSGNPADLPVACETNTCDCANDNGFTAKPPPMQWKTDGTAFCPQGYHLHMPPAPSQRLTI